jgi:uncharacterized protein YbjT (DUF2867 family)
MKIVVVGGSGLIGSHTVAQLNTHGHEAVVAAPSTGVDTITGAGLANALDGADVVVDVTNSPSWDDAAVMEFFLTSTRNLLAAEDRAGVGHHVALSVVGTERMLTSGYFRAKIVQESLIRSGSIPHTIVRATQFFEFITAIADTATSGDTVRLPPSKIQPIAAIDVAAGVANASMSSPINGITEIAGPDTFQMDELVRTVLRANRDPRQVITDPDAPYYGWVRLDDQTLLPGDGAQLGVTRLTDWLDEHSS